MLRRGGREVFERGVALNQHLLAKRLSICASLTLFLHFLVFAMQGISCRIFFTLTCSGEFFRAHDNNAYGFEFKLSEMQHALDMQASCRHTSAMKHIHAHLHDAGHLSRDMFLI